MASIMDAGVDSTARALLDKKGEESMHSYGAIGSEDAICDAGSVGTGIPGDTLGDVSGSNGSMACPPSYSDVCSGKQTIFNGSRLAGWPSEDQTRTNCNSTLARDPESCSQEGHSELATFTTDMEKAVLLITCIPNQQKLPPSCKHIIGIYRAS